MEYDTEEDKKLILQDKLKALKNLLRFWENTYNDLCKSVAETDDLLCTAVGAAWACLMQVYMLVYEYLGYI